MPGSPIIHTASGNNNCGRGSKNERSDSKHVIPSSPSSSSSIATLTNNFRSSGPSTISGYRGSADGGSSINLKGDASLCGDNCQDYDDDNCGDPPLPPMDRGYGWVVVAACFVLECLVDGQRSAFGVYQDYYTNEQFKGQASQSSISMIGTISNGGLGLMSVLGGLCADRFGYRPTILTGVVIFSLGFFLASFSTKVWQLMLTQGLMTAVGGMLVIAPATSVPSKWFLKRRGVANGVVSAGAGVGSIAHTLATQAMLSKVGMGWTLRIVAATCFVVGTACSLLLKSRMPSMAHGSISSSMGAAKYRGDEMTMRQILTSPLIYLFMVVYMLCNAAFYIPPYFLPQYAEFNGLSSELGAGLLSLFGGGSAIGRVVSGFMADYLGAMSTMLGVVTLAGIDTLVFWPLAKVAASQVAFSLTFGTLSGSFYPLATMVGVDLFGTTHLATVNGMFRSAGGVGSLVGSPIAGLLLDKSQGLPSPYLPMSLFSGSIIIFASCCIAGALVRVKIRRRAKNES